jgi:hypothetical protein
MSINKKYVKLTDKGVKHIIDTCKKRGDSLFTGSNGAMSFTSYVDDNNVSFDNINKTWTCNVGTTDPSVMGERITSWINKYSMEYNLDANYLGGLIETESQFKMWAYVPLKGNSSASGMCQFLLKTFWAVVIDSRNAYGGNFSQQQKNLIGTDDNNTVRTSFDYYDVTTNLGRRSRRLWLHQNIIDNPELSIKAMCAYIAFIADRCGGNANTTLFCYNRGPKFASVDYKLAVSKAKAHTSTGNYHEEGVNYVYKIFKILDKNYGYSLL